jgi:hypothetical protein
MEWILLLSLVFAYLVYIHCVQSDIILQELLIIYLNFTQNDVGPGGGCY